MNRHFLKFIAGLLIFGSNGIVASHIGMPSFEIVLLRTFIGSIAMFLIFFLRGGRLELKAINKKHLTYLFLSGVALGASWIFLYEAYRVSGVGTSTLLYYCGPVLVIALAPVLFHEKAEPFVYVCLALVLCGMVLTNLRLLAGEGINLHGLKLSCMAAVMFAVMMITGRRAESITGLKKSALQIFFSFLAVAAFVLPRYELQIPASGAEWFWVLVIGIVNTGLGCYCYFASLNELPVRTVSVTGYLEPLTAVVLSALLLHEAFGLVEATGAALILGGACIMECRSCLQHLMADTRRHALRPALSVRRIRLKRA